MIQLHKIQNNNHAFKLYSLNSYFILTYAPPPQSTLWLSVMWISGNTHTISAIIIYCYQPGNIALWSLVTGLVVSLFLGTLASCCLLVLYPQIKAKTQDFHVSFSHLFLSWSEDQFCCPSLLQIFRFVSRQKITYKMLLGNGELHGFVSY